MRWERLGKIFDPTKFNMQNGCSEFAQSPQTIVFNDFVRIYFSTRKRDENGEYISLIAFIDMNHELTEIINFSKKEVIGLGSLGTFDEHGIFPIHPFRDGETIYAFTNGWSRRKSVPVETSIGLAKSENNGETFVRLGNGPILTSSLHEPFLVGDGFVLKVDSMYYMWYIYANKWLEKTEHEPVARIYKITYATSTDLTNWKRNSCPIIPDILNENECQALPTVLKIGDTFHMYFCFREATDFRTNPSRSYKIGYAYSKDLKSWIRDDKLGGVMVASEKNEWDSEMQCYPHLFEIKNQVYLLINGNEFGKNGFGLMKLINED